MKHRLNAISAMIVAIFVAGCATQAPTIPPVAQTPTAQGAPSRPAAPATAQAVTPGAGPAGAATPLNPAAAAAAAAGPGPGSGPPLRPFAELIRDAKKTEGLLTLYEKDDRVYLELTPEQLGQLFFFQANVARGVPDVPNLSAFRMARSHAITFKRQHNTLQVIARNFKHSAAPKTPLARAVDAITSDSLLASVPVLSLPHAERKSFLVDASAIFFTDLIDAGGQIERTFRSGYAFDARNSTISKVRSSARLTALTVNAHYATARLPSPTPGPTPSPVPAPTPVASTPDARSFFLSYHYSIARLPETPMRTREADDRIGHFNMVQWNYSDAATPFARKYLVRRWRLERADELIGTDTLAEPKKPITFWIDKNVPNEYRDAVRDGILEWNKAFEKIGFKNALVAKQQEDDDEEDTDDTMRASVKWFVDYSDGALAVGPSTYDPRTGEILDADITIGAGWARLPRRGVGDLMYRPIGSKPAVANAHEHSEYCNQSEVIVDEAAFAMDLLNLRGTLPLDGPEATAISQDVVRAVVTHEVGHTLGFRHNFRASTIYTLAQTSDPEFTKINGVTGSIMDYVPFNVALKGEQQGSYYGTTIGPYDYWAVEYAYKEFAPDKEKAGLAAIANRSADPLLAYATDDEISSDGDGMDPEVNQRDLGNDSVAYAKRRIALTRELWLAAQTQPLALGESNAIQRRRVDSSMTLVEGALGFLAKNIGGVTFFRDHAGTGRANYTPVPATRQRDALQYITEIAFRDDTFVLPTEFMSRLPADSLDRTAGFGNHVGAPMSISFGDRLVRLQGGLLDRMFSDRVAARVLEAPALTKDVSSTLPLDEIYATVENAVWSDATGQRDISPARRALQREHAKRISAALTRPANTNASAEARALHRQTAKRLVSKLDQAMRANRFGAATRAHLDDVRDTLNAALQATTQRASS